MFCIVLGAIVDLAATMQLSINDHIVSIPRGILPAPPMRLESLDSSQGGHVFPTSIEVPNIKSIGDLKDHLNISSIFRMKHDWLQRYITTRCSILLC
jgi:hypothetical protein